MLVHRQYKFGTPSTRLLLEVSESAHVVKVSEDGSRVTIEMDEACVSDIDARMTEAGYSVNQDMRIIFRCSSPMVSEAVAITQDSDWQILGRAVTNPGSPIFGVDPACVFGRGTCVVRTQGDGAVFRVVEDDLTTVRELTQPGGYGISDTSGLWQFCDGFNTVVPPTVGTHEFRVEAKRGGAQLFEVRGLTLSMIELYMPNGS
jgi:hypothetical protein